MSPSRPIRTLRQDGVRRAGLRALVDRGAFAGQRRLVRRNDVRLQKVGVGRDDVAGLEQEQVTVGGRDRRRMAVRAAPARGAVMNEARASPFWRGTPGRNRHMR